MCLTKLVRRKNTFTLTGELRPLCLMEVYDLCNLVLSFGCDHLFFSGPKLCLRLAILRLDLKLHR